MSTSRAIGSLRGQEVARGSNITRSPTTLQVYTDAYETTKRSQEVARRGNTARPQTTLQVYTDAYETTMRDIAPPSRKQLTKYTPSDADCRALKKLDAWYDKKLAEEEADLEMFKKDVDDLLTAPVRARLNEHVLAFINMSTEQRRRLERNGMAPEPTLDLLYMELSPESRFKMAKRGEFAPPAPSQIANVLSSITGVANEIGQAVAGFASGFFEAAKGAADAALQPAPAPRYLQILENHDIRTLPSSRAPSTMASTRYDTET